MSICSLVVERWVEVVERMLALLLCCSGGGNDNDSDNVPLAAGKQGPNTNYHSILFHPISIRAPPSF